MKSKIYGNYRGVPYVSFEYEELPVAGVGKHRKPFINMDPYIDTSMNHELYSECLIGLALCDEYKFGNIVGGIPPFEKEKYGGNDGWTEIVRNISKLDKDDFHSINIRKVLDRAQDRNKALYRYIYMAMGSPIPWYFAYMLYDNAFGNKAKSVGKFTKNVSHFPLLKKYIDSLPFTDVGRIMFFTTYPNAGVVTHRDSPLEKHKDHNINLFFKPGRPSFIWDSINQEKIYLDKGATSYFFNNRDYHGVDPEPTFQFTLRVDGTFEPWLQEKLGLVDGYTWNEEYENYNP
jgi:hypothetical protein